MTNPMTTTDFVYLCTYASGNVTLGSRKVSGGSSSYGTPTKKIKIDLAMLREIIAHAERTGEPE